MHALAPTHARTAPQNHLALKPTIYLVVSESSDALGPHRYLSNSAAKEPGNRELYEDAFVLLSPRQHMYACS